MHEVINLYQGSQPQHYWNLGLIHPLWFALLCITGFVGQHPWPQPSRYQERYLT